MQENKLKQLWRDGKTALNGWLTIPSAWTAEVAAHAGFDAITLDLQHGLADYQTAVSMLQAASSTDVVPLARVAWNDPAIIMRILDAGALGIICPLINTRAECEAFVGACRYPPAGYRSFGPIRPSLRWGGDYFRRANETVLTLAMIETAQAMENLTDLAATPGLDGFYVGPWDLSIALGLTWPPDFQNADLLAALDRILDAAAKQGLVAGAHASTPETAGLLSELGFRLVSPGGDSAWLQAATAAIVSETRTCLARASRETGSP